jgi:hypothetical protein
MVWGRLATFEFAGFYPRPELAAKYLQVFDVGLTSARALFAKRLMGKSEFCLVLSRRSKSLAFSACGPAAAGKCCSVGS